MSEAANRAIVRRYFEEVLDAGNRAVMAELFAAGAKQHFPGRDLTFDPANAGTRADQTMHTDLHHLLMDGDFVVAHLTHHVTYNGKSAFITRIGPADTSDRSIHWDATAIFRLQDGKIVEERVNRDELNILAQLDAVALKSAV
jgi:ketosteroid isomerase-like protein